VVHNDDDEISLVSFESGTTSTLMVPGWRNIEYLSWAAAGDALYINPGFSVSGKYSVLLRVELDGQITMLRDRPNEWHVFPRVSPNGRHLAFSVMPFHGNAWLLEDFR
jgi:hypothetical protein